MKWNARKVYKTETQILVDLEWISDKKMQQEDTSEEGVKEVELVGGPPWGFRLGAFTTATIHIPNTTAVPAVKIARVSYFILKTWKYCRLPHPLCVNVASSVFVSTCNLMFPFLLVALAWVGVGSIVINFYDRRWCKMILFHVLFCCGVEFCINWLIAKMSQEMKILRLKGHVIFFLSCRANTRLELPSA